MRLPWKKKKKVMLSAQAIYYDNELKRRIKTYKLDLKKLYEYHVNQIDEWRMRNEGTLE